MKGALGKAEVFNQLNPFSKVLPVGCIHYCHNWSMFLSVQGAWRHHRQCGCLPVESDAGDNTPEAAQLTVIRATWPSLPVRESGGTIQCGIVSVKDQEDFPTSTRPVCEVHWGS